MASSERVAVAAHLHVALRRKAGRVTDTDWMAQNDEYAAEIVRYARERAREEGDGNLAELAEKLAVLLQLGKQAKPAHALVTRVAQGLRTTPTMTVVPGRGETADSEDADRYIGGLR